MGSARRLEMCLRKSKVFVGNYFTGAPGSESIGKEIGDRYLLV